jgi:hypothetical protein
MTPLLCISEEGTQADYSRTLKCILISVISFTSRIWDSTRNVSSAAHGWAKYIYTIGRVSIESFSLSAIFVLVTQATTKSSKKTRKCNVSTSISPSRAQ